MLPYFYETDKLGDLIKEVQDLYAEGNSFHFNKSKAMHYVMRFDVNVIKSIPSLIKHLTGTGLSIALMPGEATPIHVDHLAIPGYESTRNIAINIPISLSDSITTFYKKPDLVTHFKEGYTSSGHYIKEVPVAQYKMTTATLINTSEWHKVKNLGNTIRTIVSISFKTEYSMYDCVDIIESL
jgi:hypothetical protein